MHIVYITRANLCLRRAHSHNILSTVSVLNTLNDVRVVLVSSGTRRCTNKEVFERHAIEGSISIKRRRSILAYVIKERSSFDVLYVRDPRLIAIMAIARFILNKKVVFEIHGSHEWRGFLFLWKLAARVAGAHVFITKLLQEYYSSGSKPSVVIPCNGLQLETFMQLSSSRASLALPEDAFLILYLGSQEKYYDVSILIRMLPLVDQKISLALVGVKDEEKKSLGDIALAYGVRDRVHLVGRVNYTDIPRYLGTADVLANPKVRGYYGSVSSKLYEYLAAGKPIVASVVPADLEVLSEKNALIVAPTSEDFARAVTDLFHHSEDRVRLSRAAREDAAQYSEEKRREKFRQFLHTLNSPRRSYRLSHQREITAERYETIMYGLGSYDACMWEWEKKILDKEVDRIRDARYLDFGCGTGRILSYLEGRVKESTGVDNSHVMLERAKMQARQSRIIEVDITTDDVLQGQQYDLITAFRIFLNAEPALRCDILRILVPKIAPGGTFIFNIHGNTFSYRFLMVLWYRMRGRHLHHLSYWGVKRMLAPFNCKIERMYGFGIIPKPLYRFVPKRPLFMLDCLLARIPLFKYISYNMVFVCTP